MTPPTPTTTTDMPARRETRASRGGSKAAVRRKPGRPRGRTTVERSARPAVAPGQTLRVTLKLREGGPDLTKARAQAALKEAFELGRNQFGFRLRRWQVKDNVIQILCTAEDRRALSRGLQGLSIRIARNVNRVTRRTGKLFADRYAVSLAG